LTALLIFFSGFCRERQVDDGVQPGVEDTERALVAGQIVEVGADFVVDVAGQVVETVLSIRGSDKGSDLKGLQVFQLNDGSARGSAVREGDDALQIADAGVAPLLLLLVRPLGVQRQVRQKDSRRRRKGVGSY